MKLRADEHFSIGIDISPLWANSPAAVLRGGFIIGMRFQGVK